MDNRNDLLQRQQAGAATKTGQEGNAVQAKEFISTVFTYMTAALGLSAVMAWFFANTPALMNLLMAESGMTGLGFVVMLAPLGFVIAMSFGLEKMSVSTLLTLFIAYSAVMGMSLSFILLAYASSTLYLTFGVTAATFLTMALLGYTTDTDLTKFGSLLMMGLFGIIIAMVINWFLASPMLEYLISVGGVLIFTGLTAYDTQKLKEYGGQADPNSAATHKFAIMGALSLYLNFVNLFLFLLRLLGGRD